MLNGKTCTTKSSQQLSGCLHVKLKHISIIKSLVDNISRVIIPRLDNMHNIA